MPRVIFTFDEKSLATLKKMTDDAEMTSMASTVREALRLANTLRLQAEQGFTEVLVRKPKTHEQRVLILDQNELFANVAAGVEVGTRSSA